MTDTTGPARVTRRARHEAIRAEVAVEEAEAGEAEAVEKSNALDVPMHLRIDSGLDEQLRQRASGEGIPTSALVRRLLRQAMQQGPAVLSPADVENIARRVAREELQVTEFLSDRLQRLSRSGIVSGDGSSLAGPGLQ
jgi:hypothetical protein